MSEATNYSLSLRRTSTGIVGLDTILGGGLFASGHYLIIGPPGAGKTILGNQLCFNHIATGGRAIYVSLLAETNSRLLGHLQPLKFFTPAPIGDALYYLSGSAAVNTDGLDGLLKLLRTETRNRRASLLVIDGTSVFEQSTDQSPWLEFLHALYVSAEINRCTTILLAQTETASHAQQTVADGVIELTVPQFGMRTARELQVHKFRGSSFLEGRHLYTISDEGVIVHPRTEAVLAVPSHVLSSMDGPPPQQAERHNLGIARLDEMMRGGLPVGSTTLLLGTSGTGKTLLGSHFLLTGSHKGQRGLYFGFYETPQQLTRKMTRFGLDMGQAQADGQLEVLWQSPIQDIIDKLAERLLTALERGNVRRLFIDGLAGFQRTIASSERLDLFMAALFTRLREHQVTTICSVELPSLFSTSLDLPTTLEATTALADNIIFLRYVELQAQLYRLISVLKMRESGYDAAIREFRITDKGIDVAATFGSAQAILTGVALPSTALFVQGSHHPQQGENS